MACMRGLQFSWLIFFISQGARQLTSALIVWMLGLGYKFKAPWAHYPQQGEWCGLYACGKFERQNDDELKPHLCGNDRHTGIQVQKIHDSQHTLESRAHLSSVRQFRVLSPGVVDLHRILNTDVLYNKKVNAVIKLVAKGTFTFQFIA